MKYKFGVFIGRFQPFHIAHLKTTQFALTRVEKLIIAIDSSNEIRTIKNPWTLQERKDMISLCLSSDELTQIEFIEIKNHLYSGNLWISTLQEKIDTITSNENVVLFGNKKINKTQFPNWAFVETKFELDIHTSCIRELFFRQDKIGLKHVLPEKEQNFIFQFLDTQDFKILHAEHLKMRSLND